MLERRRASKLENNDQRIKIAILALVVLWFCGWREWGEIRLIRLAVKCRLAAAVNQKTPGSSLIESLLIKPSISKGTQRNKPTNIRLMTIQIHLDVIS